MLISFLILKDHFFLKTATDNRRCCTTAFTMLCKTSQPEDKLRARAAK